MYDYDALAWKIAARFRCLLVPRLRYDLKQTLAVIVRLARKTENYDRLGLVRFRRLAQRELYQMAKNEGFYRPKGRSFYTIREEIAE